ANDLFEEDDHFEREEHAEAAQQGGAQRSGEAPAHADQAHGGGENGQNGEGRRRRRRRRGGRGRRRGHGHDQRTGEIYPLESELQAGAEQMGIDAEYEPHDDEDEIGAAPTAVTDEQDLVEMTGRQDAFDESAEALRRAPDAAFEVENAD